MLQVRNSEMYDFGFDKVLLLNVEVKSFTVYRMGIRDGGVNPTQQFYPPPPHTPFTDETAVDCV